MNESVMQQHAEALTTLLPLLMRQIFRLDENDPTIELPLAQLRVCYSLREEPQTMSALSRELSISLSAMTQITDRLERAQLVERSTDEDDRRVKLLKLTPRAEELLLARRERRIRQAMLVLERLSVADREKITEMLNTLLAASHADNPPRSDDPLFSNMLDE